MVHDTPERDDYQGTSPTGDEGIKRAKHVSQRGRQMPATALEVARLFRSYDLWPIDFAWGHREPSGADAVGWPDRRHDGDSLVEIWGDGNLRNIGLMNGMKVNKVCDADWDNRIARMAAVYFMPTTEMHWGRNSRPDTHGNINSPTATTISRASTSKTQPGTRA